MAWNSLFYFNLHYLNMKKKLTFVISKARNGEWKVTPKSRNGNILFKETYKNKSSLKKILNNFTFNIQSYNFEIIEK